MAADYYAILKNAIGSLPDSTGEARRAVYEKARRAVVDQLKSFEPPLSATEITQERLRLEDCIRRVESEAAKGILTQSLGRTMPPQPVAPSPTLMREPATQFRPTSEPATQFRPSPEPLSRPAETPTQMRLPPRNPPPQGLPPATGLAGVGHHPLQAPHPVQTAPAPRSGFAAPPQHYAPTPLEQATQRVEQIGAEVAESAQHARDQLLVQSHAQAEADAGYENTSQIMRRRPQMPPEPDMPLGRPRKSAGPIIAAFGVGVLVVGIGALALWSQRDRIATYFGVQKSAGLTPGKVDAGGAPPKNGDRLGADDTPAKPDAGIKPVQTQAIAVPDAQAKADAPVAAAPQPVLPPVGQSSSAPPVAPAVQPVPLISQRVTLQEEGAPGSDQPIISQGKVVWQTIKEPPQGGKPPQTILRGRIEIPDRKMTLLLSMQPNSDPSMPASHTIDLQFGLPADFDGKGIAKVPGLIVKPNESNTGQPLTAAAAKVLPGKFLVALSSSESDKQRNLALLRDGGWLSIPVIYENGKRGLILIEKGSAGDAAFGDALTAWK